MQVKAERFFLVRRAGFGWSDRPDDAVPQADRERVVAGALIQEELAWLRDESFDLDLIGFDATELTSGFSWATTGCCTVTPR